jgi:aminobenzoyl-glutamate utilization protein B
MTAMSASVRVASHWLRNHVSELTALSDAIGTFAEPGLREYRSAAALEDYLEGYGFRVTRGVAGMPTAFVAEWGKGTPVVGVMCEYDATPGDSQHTVPYRAPRDPDACGFPDLHNGIGAASAVAAVAAAQTLEALGHPGTIRVFGTPGEKICVGKPFMARDGLFDALDAVIAWHPRTYSTVEWDTGPGCYEAQVLDFEGVGAYASAPWAGVSALDGAIVMNVLVQFMREHIPRQYVATVNEIFTAGGQHPTSLPSHAQAWYVYRSPRLEGIVDVRNRLARAAAAADLAMGTQHRRRIVAATRPWLPNHALARHCYANLRAAGAPRFSQSARLFAGQMLEALGLPADHDPFDESLYRPSSGVTAEFAGGADDVTEFCWHAPTARIYVAYGLNAPKLPNWTGSAFALTDVAHATVLSAARAVAFSVVDAFAHPTVLQEAREEFRQRTDHAMVRPLLPEDAVPPVDLSFPPHFPAGWSPPTIPQ